ncbi:hypothetical protein [Methanobacterium sp.]
MKLLFIIATAIKQAIPVTITSTMGGGGVELSPIIIKNLPIIIIASIVIA